MITTRPNAASVPMVVLTSDHYSPTDMHYGVRGLYRVLMLALERDRLEEEDLQAVRHTIVLLDELLTLDEFQYEAALRART